jgi:putative membrane protein insertion efficiency factor
MDAMTFPEIGDHAEGQRRRRWHDNLDCGGCDAPSCDIPGCDVPGCDVPCCDFALVSTMLLGASAVAGGRRSRPRSGPRPALDRAALAAIRGYRRVSPRLPTRCRYTPTCSAYGLVAVERHGLKDGGRMTAARLRRCRPGVAYGTKDPVP